MAFKRPSVQFCPAPPDSLKTPDHRKMVGGLAFFIIARAVQSINWGVLCAPKKSCCNILAC